MASSASMPAPAKRLKEHLQDQQEPFNLHSYLSERSYVKTSCSLDHSVDSAKNPTRPPSSGIHKGRNGILHAKTILASAMYKLIPTNTSREYSLCSKRNQGLTNVGTTIAFEFGNSETVEVQTLQLIKIMVARKSFRFCFQLVSQHHFVVVPSIKLTKLTDCYRYKIPLDMRGRSLATPLRITAQGSAIQ